MRILLPDSQIYSMSTFTSCDHHMNCLFTAPIMICVTIVPFVLLVLFDSMLCYHLYLSLSCLFVAFFGLNRPRLPEWSELCARFHRAPTHWWTKCTSAWGKKNSSDSHMPGISGSKAGLLPNAPSKGDDLSALGHSTTGCIKTQLSTVQESLPLSTAMSVGLNPAKESLGTVYRTSTVGGTSTDLDKKHVRRDVSSLASNGGSGDLYSASDFETVAQWASFAHVWNALVRGSISEPANSSEHAH